MSLMIPPWAIKAAREAAGEAAAPDDNSHLWFSDRNYSGHSEYRKGEGWIDVLSFDEWGSRRVSYGATRVKRAEDTDREVFVVCAPDPVYRLLWQLNSSGKHVDTAVLEMRRRNGWLLRWTLKHVTLTEVNEGNGGSNFTIGLTSKRLAVVSIPPGV